MTLAEAKMFIRNAENFITVFGEELFEKVVANYDYKVFSTYEYVIRDGNQDKYFASKGYPVLCDRTEWTFKEYNGEWMREVRKLAREYRVPDHYQCEEGNLLRDCIIAVNPLMSMFEISTYHLDKPTDDIYIKTEHKSSLYVPVRAITEKNFSLVIDRHTSYHKSYYNTVDRKEYLNKALAALDSKVAKILKIVIEDGEED